jgi:hypothetical protein
MILQHKRCPTIRLMQKLTFLVFPLLICSNLLFCQDYSFTWKISPSLAGGPYTITVTRSGNYRFINLQNQYEHLDISRKIDGPDVDSLYQFLVKYDFKDKGSNIISGATNKDYAKTTLLPDSAWVVINGDTLRKDYVELRYSFDDSSKTFYAEQHKVAVCGDGTHYEGNFTTRDVTKEYNIYCAHLNDIDFQLNQLIEKLVIKYFKEDQYKILIWMINLDKPRKL